MYGHDPFGICAKEIQKDSMWEIIYLITMIKLCMIKARSSRLMQFIIPSRLVSSHLVSFSLRMSPILDLKIE